MAYRRVGKGEIGFRFMRRKKGGLMAFGGYRLCSFIRVSVSRWLLVFYQFMSGDVLS